MTLHRAGLIALDLDPVEPLAGGQVAHLEPEQAIHVDEAERLPAVDREGPDRRREGPLCRGS